MWNKLPVSERMELLKAYKIAHKNDKTPFTYQMARKDYDETKQKLDDDLIAYPEDSDDNMSSYNRDIVMGINRSNNLQYLHSGQRINQEGYDRNEYYDKWPTKLDYDKDHFKDIPHGEFRYGGVITDPRGQYAHPGEVTRIPSNNITMKGVPYPVLGVSDTGDEQMMYPDGEYEFGGNSVTEYPQRFQKGGKYSVKDNLNQPVYNPSETVNQPRFEDPYKRAASLKQSDNLNEQDYLKEQESIRQNENKTRLRIRQQNEFNKSRGVQQPLYDENYEVKKDIEGKEYQKQLNKRTNMMMLEAGLFALPIAGELLGARYLKNAWKYNPNRFKTNPNNYYHRSPNPLTTIKDKQFVGYGKTEEGAAKLAKEIDEHHKKWGKKNSWINIKKPVKDEPYFSKGVGLDGGRTNNANQNFWAGQEGVAQEYPGPYLVEAKNTDFIAKIDGKLQRVLNKDGLYETGIPPTGLGNYATPKYGSVPIKDIKIYKEHWWDGYRPDSDNYRTIFKP